MNTEFDTRKPDFEKAQNAATDLLLQQNISGLYVDVRKFSFDRPIKIDSLQNYARITKRPVTDFTCDKISGCCLVKHPRCSIILYDENEMNECRKHWGITHEIGHVYLGHKQDRGVDEVEAHYFAAQIVMPECVIQEIINYFGPISARDICAYFNASYESAQKRIETLSKRGVHRSWKDRDKQLLEKFKPYIHHYREEE